MGAFCSFLNKDKKRLVAILNEEGRFSKEDLRRLKAVLDFKRNRVVNENGVKHLDIELLVAIKDTITNGFNEKLVLLNFGPFLLF